VSAAERGAVAIDVTDAGRRFGQAVRRARLADAWRRGALLARREDVQIEADEAPPAAADGARNAESGSAPANWREREFLLELLRRIQQILRRPELAPVAAARRGRLLKAESRARLG